MNILRKTYRLKRLIHNAGFDQPEASIMDINYTSGRRVNKELINRLATCEYISEHRNLFITGEQAVVKLTWPVPSEWRFTHLSKLGKKGGYNKMNLDMKR